MRRQTAKEVCPWNVKFARALRDGSPFAPRAFIAGQDAATLTRDLRALDDEGVRPAFSKSLMKRAKLAGLQRNAEVVLAHTPVDHKTEVSGSGA